MSIGGTPQVGVALTRVAGTYSPNTGTAGYQWQQCDAAGSNCASIPGATSTSYTAVAADQGKTIRVVETITLAGYTSGGSTSSATAAVAAGTLSTTTAASISGTPQVGVALTRVAGTYSPAGGAPSYQWRQCDAAGASCADIAGATGTCYTPVAADQGKTIRLVETIALAGYTSGGSTSAASSTVAAGDFSTTTGVSTSGTAQVGQTLTRAAGTYSPVPSGRTYQWRQCDPAGANCVDISGATGTSYTPVAADQGKTIRVVETITLAGYANGGSTSAAASSTVAAGSDLDHHGRVDQRHAAGRRRR